jgi:hypothetical protein
MSLSVRPVSFARRTRAPREPQLGGDRKRSRDLEGDNAVALRWDLVSFNVRLRSAAAQPEVERLVYLRRRVRVTAVFGTMTQPRASTVG